MLRLTGKGARMRTLYIETNDANPAVDWWKPLSYVVDWREAFQAEPRLEVEICNPHNAYHYGTCMRRIQEYDLIVISHAATGDDMTRLLETRAAFDGRKGKMAVFIGNEYDIMHEKITFIRDTEAEFVCTQLPIKAARWLYEECLSSQLLALPHALNPSRYYTMTDHPRPVDIGFKGDIYYPWVGDVERTLLIQHFASQAEFYAMNVDIQTKRVDGDEWCRFLNDSKGIIGAESGTYYLNERGGLLRRAKEHMKQYPNTTFQELHELYFTPVADPVSGKAISSRHFEPMGTRTCQLLLEGEYNGILLPDVHYIPIKRDLSNILEVVFKFDDTTYREGIANAAYDHAMNQ